MYVYINIGNSGASGHGTCVSFCSSMHSSVLDSGSAWGMLRLEEVRVTSMKRKMKDLRTTMIMTIVMMMMMIMTIMIMMMMMMVVVVMMMMMKWGYNVDASFVTNHHYHFYYRIQKRLYTIDVITTNEDDHILIYDPSISTSCSVYKFIIWLGSSVCIAPWLPLTNREYMGIWIPMAPDSTLQNTGVTNN